jgi:hypothetical protein
MSSAGAAPRAAVPVSNARAEASRKNGAKSRGPKTPAGKARSSRNALKHGLRAERHVVLPAEDGAEFEALEAAMTLELALVGALQTVLARRVAVAAWRLARADRIETELFAYRCRDDANLAIGLMRDGNGTRSVETLLRYRGAAQAELTRALRTLKALQAEQAMPARAPVRLAAVRSGSVATPSDRPAARVKKPDEPERRGNGRISPPRLIASSDPGLSHVLSSLPQRPMPEAALQAQPSEPDTGGLPGKSAPSAKSDGPRSTAISTRSAARASSAPTAGSRPPGNNTSNPGAFASAGADEQGGEPRSAGSRP